MDGHEGSGRAAGQTSRGDTSTVEATTIADRSDVPTLWLDRFADLLGFGWLSDRLPWNVPPSYLYALMTIVIWRAAATAYNLANEVEFIHEVNPYFLLQPFILLGAVYGARTLHYRYARVMDEMRIDERMDDPSTLRDIVPSWLPWALFGVGAALQLSRAVMDMAAFNTTGMVANFVVFPFVYLPILVQFVVVYVAIEFVAPYRLKHSDVGVDFLDPHGVGGLRPLGELVKTAYYYIVAGLVAYALITYAPFVSTPEWEVSAAAGAIFTAVWVATVATVGFAVFTLHRFMREEKREELQRLEDERRDILENPWDVTDYEVPADRKDRVDDINDRIDSVSATSEYPATFSIWSQLLLSIVIPKAIQLVLANL